jgi:glucokinase
VVYIRAVRAIGVDVGGSGVRAARVGANGIDGPRAARTLDRTLGREQVAERLRDVVAELQPGADDAGVAVAFPGFRDDAGRVAFAANLPGLDGLVVEEVLAPVADGLALRGLPDLAAAAVGEARLGAGRGAERFLCVSLGTGVNAALTAGGTVVDVAYGCFGDAGHVNVEPDGPECPCGGRGCLEAVASGAAFAREGAPLGLRDGAAVVAAARAGHPEAGAIVARAGAALGRALAGWAAIAFPERVAVTGGLSAAGELLLGPAREELERVGAPYVVERMEIVMGELGADAALTGAGLTALAEAVRA